MTGVHDNIPPPPNDPGHERGSTRFFSRRRALQTPSEALHPQAAPPPPSPPNSERRPILSALSGLLSLALVAAIVGLFGLSLASRTLSERGPLAADKVIYIVPGTEVVTIIDKLSKENVIDHPTMLKAALWASRKWSKVKAGEYLFKAHVSHNEVIDTLVSGKQVLHSVTIPEGLTSEQIVERLRANEILAGELKKIPPEGSLLPETYRVTRGSSRSQLVRKMQREQEKVLDRVWKKRAKDLPLNSKYELLTLAAIVEKETGRADERSRVAAVFFNRLKKRMRLQSDPTIVYGLVGGKGTLGRPILRSEILKPTPFNTYVIPALPPGPIANPGLAALEATANPSKTDDLYFVADGTGGHAFSDSLAGHNRNVARWRQIEKERAAEKAANGNGAAQPAAQGNDVDRATPEAEGQRSRSPGRRGHILFEISPFGGARAVAVGANSGAFANVEADIVIGDLARALAGSHGKLIRFVQDAKFSPLKFSPLPVSGRRAAVPAPPARTLSAAKPVGQRSAVVAAADARAAISQVVARAKAVHDKKVALKASQRQLPAGVTAYAPRALPPPAADRIAAAAPESAGETGDKASGSKMKIVLAPGIETMNLKIIGVTPDVTDSPLDGPIFEDRDDGTPSATGRIATAPMSEAKRANLARRAAKYANVKTDFAPFQGGDIENQAQAIPEMLPETKTPVSNSGKKVRTAGLAKPRRAVYDASVGTKHDPLKARHWDLNTAHTVPRIR
jgi:cell division protein YceG involved in septum cleavage